MVFKFRICEDSDRSDTAQGWVVAGSELRARQLLGPFAYLQVMPLLVNQIEHNDTIFLTLGALPD